MIEKIHKLKSQGGSRIVYVIVVLLLVKLIKKYIFLHQKLMDLRKNAENKRKMISFQAEVPNLNTIQLNPSQKSQFNNSELLNIIELIRLGKVTKLQVLKFYADNIKVLDQASQIVTENNIANIYMKLKEESGIQDINKFLTGIPFSVPDEVSIKGYDSSLGLIKNCFNPSQENASIIDLLIKLGGFPIVKTVPLSFCNLPRWKTMQEDELQIIPEAEIVHQNGVLFSLSICTKNILKVGKNYGLLGFRFSSGMLPTQGIKFKEKLGIQPGIGLIGKSSQDLRYLFQSIIDINEKQKNNKVQTSLGSVNGLKTLKIGYMRSVHNYFQDEERNASGFNNVIEKLQDIGCELVEMKFRSLFSGIQNFLKQTRKNEQFIVKTEQKRFLDFTTKDLIQCSIQEVINDSKSYLVSKFCGLKISQKIKSFFKRSGESRENRKRLLIESFLTEWKTRDLDILLIPCPTPSTYHGDMEFDNYANIFDFLDVPTGILEIKIPQFSSTKFYDNGSPLGLKVVNYEDECTLGTRLSLQVVGMSLKDSICLSSMQQLEKLFNEV